jgi:2-methylcitrate dehydratase
MFKYYPTEFNSQVAVHIALGLATRVDVDAIESVDVTTYRLAWHEIGGGQGDAEEKWDPRTRETADHSLPYLLAVALTNRRIDLDSFTESQISDPALRPLMKKISVSWDEAFEERHKHHEWPVRIVLRLTGGTELREELFRPRGLDGSSMSDEELDDKYARMVRPVLKDPEAYDDLRDRLWHLAAEPDVAGMTAGFRRFGASL